MFDLQLTYNIPTYTTYQLRDKRSCVQGVDDEVLAVMPLGWLNDVNELALIWYWFLVVMMVRVELIDVA